MMKTVEVKNNMENKNKKEVLIKGYDKLGPEEGRQLNFGGMSFEGVLGDERVFEALERLDERVRYLILKGTVILVGFVVDYVVSHTKLKVSDKSRLDEAYNKVFMAAYRVALEDGYVCKVLDKVGPVSGEISEDDFKKIFKVKTYDDKDFVWDLYCKVDGNMYRIIKNANEID